MAQALVQTKIDRQRVESRESGRQADIQTAMVDSVWSLDGEGGRAEIMNEGNIC